MSEEKIDALGDDLSIILDELEAAQKRMNSWHELATKVVDWPCLCWFNISTENFNLYNAFFGLTGIT